MASQQGSERYGQQGKTDSGEGKRACGPWIRAKGRSEGQRAGADRTDRELSYY